MLLNSSFNRQPIMSAVVSILHPSNTLDMNSQTKEAQKKLFQRVFLPLLQIVYQLRPDMMIELYRSAVPKKRYFPTHSLNYDRFTRLMENMISWLLNVVEDSPNSLGNGTAIQENINVSALIAKVNKIIEKYCAAGAIQENINVSELVAKVNKIIEKYCSAGAIQEDINVLELFTEVNNIIEEYCSAGAIQENINELSENIQNLAEAETPVGCSINKNVSELVAKVDKIIEKYCVAGAIQKNINELSKNMQNLAKAKTLVGWSINKSVSELVAKVNKIIEKYCSAGSFQNEIFWTDSDDQLLNESIIQELKEHFPGYWKQTSNQTVWMDIKKGIERLVRDIMQYPRSLVSTMPVWNNTQKLVNEISQLSRKTCTESCSLEPHDKLKVNLDQLQGFVEDISDSQCRTILLLFIPLLKQYMLSINWEEQQKNLDKLEQLAQDLSDEDKKSVPFSSADAQFCKGIANEVQSLYIDNLEQLTALVKQGQQSVMEEEEQKEGCAERKKDKPKKNQLLVNIKQGVSSNDIQKQHDMNQPILYNDKIKELKRVAEHKNNCAKIKLNIDEISVLLREWFVEGSTKCDSMLTQLNALYEKYETAGNADMRQYKKQLSNQGKLVNNKKYAKNKFKEARRQLQNFIHIEITKQYLGNQSNQADSLITRIENKKKLIDSKYCNQHENAHVVNVGDTIHLKTDLIKDNQNAIKLIKKFDLSNLRKLKAKEIKDKITSIKSVKKKKAKLLRPYDKFYKLTQSQLATKLQSKLASCQEEIMQLNNNLAGIEQNLDSINDKIKSKYTQIGKLKLEIKVKKFQTKIDMILCSQLNQFFTSKGINDQMVNKFAKDDIGIQLYLLRVVKKICDNKTIIRYSSLRPLELAKVITHSILENPMFEKLLENLAQVNDSLPVHSLTNFVIDYPKLMCKVFSEDVKQKYLKHSKYLFDDILVKVGTSGKLKFSMGEKLTTERSALDNNTLWDGLCSFFTGKSKKIEARTTKAEEQLTKLEDTDHNPSNRSVVSGVMNG